MFAMAFSLLTLNDVELNDDELYVCNGVFAVELNDVELNDVELNDVELNLLSQLSRNLHEQSWLGLKKFSETTQ